MRAFDRASQVQSSVGTSLRAIGDHTAQLEEAGRASKARVASLEEANMAEAISGLQQSETAYNAALGAAARTTRRSLFDYLGVMIRCEALRSPCRSSRTPRRPTCARVSRATRSRFPTASPASRPAAASCCWPPTRSRRSSASRRSKGPAGGVPRHRSRVCVLASYRCRLTETDLRALGADAETTLLWFAIISAEADGTLVANLRAPIVINPQRMIGRQVLPDDGLYPIRHVLGGKA